MAVMGGDLLSTGDGGGGLAYLEGDSSEDEAERAKKEEAGKDEEPQILMEVRWPRRFMDLGGSGDQGIG